MAGRARAGRLRGRDGVVGGAAALVVVRPRPRDHQDRPAAVLLTRRRTGPSRRVALFSVQSRRVAGSATDRPYVMRPKLFTLCSAVSLLLCAAVCVLWVRSYGLIDWVQWTDHRHFPGVASSDGRMIYSYQFWPDGVGGNT